MNWQQFTQQRHVALPLQVGVGWGGVRIVHRGGHESVARTDHRRHILHVLLQPPESPIHRHTPQPERLLRK